MFPGEKGPGGGGARWGDARGHVRLSLPPGGGVRRLRRGKRACSPMGRSIASGGDPKGCRGRAESPLLFCRNIYTPWGFSPTTARRFPKGNEGKRVPSGHNRRRRLATRSSGKQQAGRTAVRTAPIVCPEESRLCFLADYGPKGVQGGNVGKRVPSGHNRRRQLATRSSGKQQVGRTAVRAAPIVCPEESPCVFSPTTARRGCRGGT